MTDTESERKGSHNGEARGTKKILDLTGRVKSENGIPEITIGRRPSG